MHYILFRESKIHQLSTLWLEVVVKKSFVISKTYRLSIWYVRIIRNNFVLAGRQRTTGDGRRAGPVNFFFFENFPEFWFLISWIWISLFRLFIIAYTWDNIPRLNKTKYIYFILTSAQQQQQQQQQQLVTTTIIIIAADHNNTANIFE